jgi:hypothetical protein
MPVSGGGFKEKLKNIAYYRQWKIMSENIVVFEGAGIVYARDTKECLL